MQLTTNFVLTRGVAQILPRKKGLADLMAHRKMTLYETFTLASVITTIMILFIYFVAKKGI